MRGDVPVRCECGAVRGRLIDLHPGGVNRTVCHCRGCRAFAAHIGREAQIFDPHGGSDVFQTSPASLVFDEGIEHIGCLRMTPKGALRWHTTCCKTPIAGSFHTRNVPFMSMYPACVDRAALPAPLDDAIGPVRVRVNGTFPRGERRALKAGVGALLPMIVRYSWMCIRWLVSGQHKRSPFFDRETARPIVEPTVIGISDDFV